MEKTSRRTFLKHSSAIGAGFGLSQSFACGGDFRAVEQEKNPENQLVGMVSSDEKQKEKLAKYVFNFSSPYYTSEHLTTPHAHMEIKNLIEKRTDNKIYVKVHDGGSQGIGSSLANVVKYNKSQGALLSISNLSPMVKEVDILNIPFWSASDDEYTRLVNSQQWEKYVSSNAKKSGLQILLHHVVGPRTVTSTKEYGKLIISPEDFEGVRIRVPGSKSLEFFYKLTNAKPDTIAWKVCARMARGGRFDALDPSIVGLHSGPEGLKKELGTISTIGSVHDGWVAIGNTGFIESLDSKTRSQFFEAFEEIQVEQVKLHHKSNELCAKEFEKMGTRVYTPTPQEIEELAKSFGHGNPAWEPVKKRLLGDNGLAVFDELYKIAQG